MKPSSFEITGCAVTAIALRHASVGFIFGVPGSPATDLCAELSTTFSGYELSLNEKIAAESAVGVSAAGMRSALVHKQCGFNSALDPLLNAAVHGIGAGVVILVGDDIDCRSSTALQDSRYLAQIAGLPVLELGDGTRAMQVINAAYIVSESAGLPVVVRFTNALAQTLKSAPNLPYNVPETALDPEVLHTIDRRRAHHLTKFGRRQLLRVEKWPMVCQQVEVKLPRIVRHADKCGRGLVQIGACGDDVVSARADVCVLQSSVSWPIGDKIREFVQSHDDVMIVEETLPFVERELRIEDTHTRSGRLVGGRLNGLLPPEGSVGLNEELTACLDGVQLPQRHSDVASKSFNGSEHLPYGVLFKSLNAVAKRGVFVAADVGSSVKLCYPPYDAATVALCLGSSISVMSGHVRATGKPGVAVIGDYGLIHSGIEAVLDMVYRSLPGVVIVLGNGVSAQTGSQITAVSRADPSALSAELLLQGCGVRRVERVQLGKVSQGELDVLINQAIDAAELHVLLLEDALGLT